MSLRIAFASVSPCKCCFHPVGDALPIEEESGPDDNRPDEQESAPDDNTLVLLGDVEWNDFVGMDDAIHTTAIHDDDWEAALVDKANGDVPDDEDCGDEEEGADEEEPRMYLHVQHFLHVMP